MYAERIKKKSQKKNKTMNMKTSQRKAAKRKRRIANPIASHTASKSRRSIMKNKHQTPMKKCLIRKAMKSPFQKSKNNKKAITPRI